MITNLPPADSESFRSRHLAADAQHQVDTIQLLMVFKVCGLCLAHSEQQDSQVSELGSRTDLYLAG
jgi:hypothetical protein